MTSKVAKPVDGDDYTWDSAPGGAVLNGASHTACEVCGQPATEILCGIVRAGIENGWQIYESGIQHAYCAVHAPLAALSIVPLDLRTPDQRERDDVAALNLRVDNLVDAVEMLTRRVAELERALVTVKG